MKPSQLIWNKFKQNSAAVFGLLLILFFFLIAVLGPLIRPDQTPKANDQHLEIARFAPFSKVHFVQGKHYASQERNFLQDWLYGTPKAYEETPLLDQNKETKSEYSKTFWLGTDRYGRDYLSRLMAGTWISFSVGLIAILISLFIGISLGLIAGYYQGKIDDLIMWFINVVWSIPTLLLVIAITLVLGKGFWQVFVAVGLTMWVEVARVVRGQVLSVSRSEFIEAGRSFGYSDFRIMLKHLLPNITGPIIVISASNFAAAILIEAGLSFLGLGAQPPQATWGKMISEHKGYIITGDAYLAIFPGIAIFLLVLSFVLLGNGLRDAFDTKALEK